MRVLGLVRSTSDSSGSINKTWEKWSEHIRAVSNPDMLDGAINDICREYA